jgi:sugar-specific transcriptional regulator TrmB
MNLKEIKDNLRELGFNANEIKVYIAVTQLGEATAAQVAKKSDLPRTTAISLLARLKEQNYVTSHIYQGITYYWVESPRIIGQVFEQKLKIAESLNSAFADLYRSEAHFPYVQTFDSKTAIKNYIEKFVLGLEKNSVLYTIDSPKENNYAKIYFKDIGEMTRREKQNKGVLTHTLVPYGSFGSIEDHKLKTQAIKIREMPERISFATSLWLTEDTVVHFSGNPVFLVAIKHDAISKGIKSIYDFLWTLSIPKN